MAPLIQRFRRSLSVKLLVILVGVLCLGAVLLALTPSHAALTPKVSRQIDTSGGGCNNSKFQSTKVADRTLSVQVCINMDGDNVVSQASLQSVNGGPCPDSVSVSLQDETSQASLTFSGCGDFTGPTLSLQPNDTYFSHVDFLYNADGGVDSSGLESPFLDSAS